MFVCLFYGFVTEAYIAYFAVHLCSMSDVASAPADVDSLTSDDDKATYLSRLSEHIVVEVWQLPSITNITDTSECQVEDHYVTDQWCLCSEGPQVIASFDSYNVTCNLLCTLHGY